MDPLGEAWQTLQGLYAIGSGGLFGLGLGNSRQKFGYVSQPQNDFIFTIICEELGFFGAAAVLLLFGLLLWRGFKIAAAAPDKFCALTVYGLVFKTVLQALLNIAVVTNSMPNTGIALPFFSSGGTALAIQIFEMGIVLNISRYSHVDK
jgi:cell division protein FtsW